MKNKQRKKKPNKNTVEEVKQRSLKIFTKNVREILNRIELVALVV